MARRLWLATLALALAAMMVVPVAAAERITVIMPRHEMDLIGLWEEQTRQFERETGIEVELIQLSWDEVADKVLIDLAAGGGTYDVIEFDNGWVAKFAAAGWVEPLDAYASEAYVESLLPGLVSTFTRNGQLLGIPWNNDTRFFFYNARMLKEAGIDTPPRTWDEVVDQARRLKAAGVVTYPIAEYWNQEWALGNSFAFYLYSFGADYFRNGRVTIDDPAGIGTLRFMVEMLREEELIHPSSVTLSQEAAADLFYQGQAAFFFQGPPVTFNYANDPQRSRVVGEIEAASWLPAADPSLQATLTLPEAFAIPRTSRNKEAAWRYISYMISPERDRERAEKLGSLPLFRSLYEDQALLARYPYWKQFGEQSERARPLPQVEWYDELVQTSIVAVQRALLGIATPEATASEIARFLVGREVDGVRLTR